MPDDYDTYDYEAPIRARKYRKLARRLFVIVALETVVIAIGGWILVRLLTA